MAARPALDTSGALPIGPVRLMVGATPYSPTGGSDRCGAISQAADYPRDRRSRARRWHDAVAELAALQAQYAAWLDALPNNQQDGATADVLRAICDLDLTELQAIEPPRGCGRE